MNIRPELLDVGAYKFEAHDAAVKLDQNESPWPADSRMQAALAEAVSSFEPNRYPDLLPFRLRAELARLHGWDEEGVTVAGGSNILIQSLVVAAGVGRTVLTVSPTFSVYALQARLLAGRLVEVPLTDGFNLDVPALKAAMAEARGVLFIASPAAPTGNVHPRAQLEELADAAGERWLVVIDEAYQQFSGVDNSELAKRPNVVVLRTFSKAAGLAGLRLGYALSSPGLGTQLQKTVLPFSVSRLQEQLALAVLGMPELMEQHVAATVLERDRVFRALQDLSGVTPHESDANFILFRVADAGAVHSALLERGVLVRRQDHLPGLEGCLRVSVGLGQENTQFLDALAAIMASQQPRG